MKRVRETKAVCASRILSGLDRTKTAKEQRATRNGAQVHRNVDTALR